MKLPLLLIFLAHETIKTATAFITSTPSLTLSSSSLGLISSLPFNSYKQSCTIQPFKKQKNNDIVHYATTANNMPPSSSSSESNNKDVTKTDDAKELTLDTLIEMLDVSFINACLQLSKGYIDVLKLFIVSVQTAYKMNISIENIIQTLADYTDESSKAANRKLLKEEILIRTIWIYLIYLTLQSLNIPKNNDTLSDNDDSSASNTTSMLLNDIKKMYNEYISYIIKNWKMSSIDEKSKFSIVSDLTVDDVVQNCKDITSTLGDTAMDTMVKAMLPQNIRVIILTLVVLEEEKLCSDNDDNNEDVVPSPPIPGTR